MSRQTGFDVKAILMIAPLLVLGAETSFAQLTDLGSLQPGHWARISFNTIDDVNPCPGDTCSWSGIEGVSAVVDDWNGGAFATEIGTLGGLIVFGGGHQGYYGNEVYVFELDDQRWVRYSEPVADPACNYSTAELQDGSPCSMHTYDYVGYHPGTNSFVLLGATSLHDEGGRGVDVPHLFDLNTGVWRAGPERPFGSGLFTGASSAYDPNRDVFWVVQAYNNPISTYDPDGNGGSGSWTQHATFNIDIDAATAVDPVHDLLVTVDGLNKQRVVIHDLANPDAGPVTVSTTGDSTLQSATKIGFEWDPVTESFVAWNGGASVYSLKPPADWRNEAWTWTRHDPAADNAVVPTAPNGNGTYSRWQYVPSLNAFIVINRTSDPVFLYKLSEGQSAPTPEPGPEPSPGGGTSWAERSTHPDVVRAVGFDSLEEFQMGRFPDERTAFNSWDTDVKASGEGSLSFLIPSGSGANSSGQWRINFSDDPMNNPVTFGEGEEFWIQWRQRFDRYFIEHHYQVTSGSGGWKQVIIGQGDGVANQDVYNPGTGNEVGSCTELHLVMHNTSQQGYPAMYHSCGWYFPLDTTVSGILSRQNQIDGCYYNDTGGCMRYVADQWMTFQVGVRIGTWAANAVDSNTGETMSGFANSEIEFWVGYEGQPSVLVHRQTGLVLRRGNYADEWSDSAHDAEYGKIWLTPYHTSKDGSEVHEDAHTWYDELIISTSKIADPAGAPASPAPMPPSNVTVVQ